MIVYAYSCLWHSIDTAPLKGLQISRMPFPTWLMSVHATSLEAPCDWIVRYAQDAARHGWGGVGGWPRWGGMGLQHVLGAMKRYVFRQKLWDKRNRHIVAGTQQLDSTWGHLKKWRPINFPHQTEGEPGERSCTWTWRHKTRT